MNRKQAAKIMGSAKTKAKKKASRENGKLGGRPKKINSVKEGMAYAIKLASDALKK